MSSVGRVIIFGGQGSATLLSRQTASTAAGDARSSPKAAIPLSRCHAAFLEEVQSIGDGRRAVFQDQTDFFLSPEDLLAPKSSYHNNGIVQSVTLCLYQLLRYLSVFERSSTSYRSALNSVLETAGFCSGMLPAVVVASSRMVQEFIDFSVEAFRLAFWIGYRSTLYCQKVPGMQWKDIPWSLVVTGLDRDQLSKELDGFREQVRSPQLGDEERTYLKNSRNIDGSTLPLSIPSIALVFLDQNLICSPSRPAALNCHQPPLDMSMHSIMAERSSRRSPRRYAGT